MSANKSTFCFPVVPLENSRLKLEFFDVDRHGSTFVEEVKDHPELWDYMPSGPFPDVQSLRTWFENIIDSDNSRVVYAIILKPNSEHQEQVLAGMIGYLNSSEQNLVSEIGFTQITVLPRFHGTFVAKNAAGLLMKYALDPVPQGLGLRRLVWQAHSKNEASRKFALKMLFTFEGVKRFERFMPENKPGNGYTAFRKQDVFGRNVSHSRDSALYAHYCDEWEEKRPFVEELMNRI